MRCSASTYRKCGGARVPTHSQLKSEHKGVACTPFIQNFGGAHMRGWLPVAQYSNNTIYYASDSDWQKQANWLVPVHFQVVTIYSSVLLPHFPTISNTNCRAVKENTVCAFNTWALFREDTNIHLCNVHWLTSLLRSAPLRTRRIDRARPPSSAAPSSVWIRHTPSSYASDPRPGPALHRTCPCNTHSIIYSRNIFLSFSKTFPVFVHCLHNSVSAQYNTFFMFSKKTNPISCFTYIVVSMTVMVHLHCRRQTRVGTRTWIRNPMATLYYAEHVHIAQTQTWIPTPYYCVG